MFQVKKVFEDKRRVIISYLLGMIYSLFIVMGHQMERSGNVIFSFQKFYLELIFLTFVVGTVLLVVYYFIPIIKNRDSSKQISQKRFYVIIGLVLFAAWLPQALGVYPGFFNYDAPGQWSMYTSGEITAHHPVLHTVFMGGIIDFIYQLTGAFNKAVFGFIMIQMLIIAGCFSYMLTWIYRKGMHIIFVGIMTAWLAFFPTVVMNVLSVTKDSLFSAFLIVFLIMNLELMEEPKRFKKPFFMIGWIVITFLTMIMRNNAIYVMILYIPLMFWLMRKYWKNMIVWIFGVIVLYLLYVGPFYSMFVTQGISSREYLSVPVQQMMRVYKEKNHVLTQKEKDIYETLFDEVAIEYYNPKISDVVKSHFNQDEFFGNLEKYKSFYIEEGSKYFSVYVNSVIQNTYGFWYPKASLILDIYGWEGYYMCHSYPPAVDNSLLPFIGEYYSLFEDSALVSGDSASTLLFAPATFFWIFLLVLGFVILEKRKYETVVLMFVLLLWMTYLLGPVALVRYVSFLYFMVPMEMTLLQTKDKA